MKIKFNNQDGCYYVAIEKALFEGLTLKNVVKGEKLYACQLVTNIKLKEYDVELSKINLAITTTKREALKRFNAEELERAYQDKQNKNKNGFNTLKEV